VGNADVADDPAGPGHPDRRRERLGGPDAFEGGIDADASRKLEDGLGRGVAPLGNDDRGPERASQCFTRRIAAESDDPRCAKATCG
jgi:hypothetical protein